MKFTMIKEDDDSLIRRSIRWILKQITKLGRLVARIINAVITVPACNLYAKTKLAWVLPILALLALAYFAAFGSMTQWWMKNLVVTVSPWNYVRGIRTAKAEELTTEQYIRLVFGKDAPTALAVAKAESGMRCDAQNVNKGTNSLDAGLFQINSVHLKKAGWKIGDLLDCHRNTDMAYKIFKGSGWGAWSVCAKKVKCK